MQVKHSVVFEHVLQFNPEPQVSHLPLLEFLMNPSLQISHEFELLQVLQFKFASQI